MREAKNLLFSFSPDKTLRHTTNFMRAQVAGQGTEKSFAMSVLETRRKLDESGYGLTLPLNIIASSTETSSIIPVLVYLDGCGYGDLTLNQLMANEGLPKLEAPVAYNLF